MIINMLIVDDEPYICHGLATTISWEDIKIKVVGVAHDGIQAKQVLKSEEVDLILTDICMPNMNGVELSRTVMRDYPKVKVIMFSGHDEFDYVREALRLGVEDYLLKPVKIDELLELAKNVSEQIRIEKQLEDKEDKVEIEEFLKQRILNLPVTTQLNTNRAYALSPYRIMISSIKKYDDVMRKKSISNMSIEKFKASWRKQLAHTLNDHQIDHVSLFSHENELITVCYRSDKEELKDGYFDSSLKETNEKLAGILQFTVSQHQTNVEDIAKVCTQLSTIHHTEREKADILFHRVKNVPGQAVKIPEVDIVLMKQALLKVNEMEMEHIIHEKFTTFVELKLSLQIVLNHCKELMTLLKNEFPQVTTGQQPFLGEFQLLTFVDLKIYNTYESLEQLLLEDIFTLANALKPNSDSHWMIENIREYIDKNFQQGLKAAEIAEKHYITPNYFSMLFKKETGSSFSEYLNSVRIQKAKELLMNTSNKVFEIAEYVGYKDYKYFVLVFRKHVGITPTEFRKYKPLKINEKNG